MEHSDIGVYSIYKLMQDNQIQFSYKGPITQDILISLGDSIKEKLHREDCDAKVVRKVFAVLVEAAHNILKYSSEKTILDNQKKSAGIGLIGISKTPENEFAIFSGNLVSKTEARDIRLRLEQINSLSKEELKQRYSTQLKTGAISPDGSAGLGLYEVARKSGRPISFSFSDADKDRVFFELKIFVNVED